MDQIQIGLWVTAGLLVMVVIGMRVAFAAALAGVVGLILIFWAKKDFDLEKFGWALTVAVKQAGQVPHSKVASHELSLIPTFILIGYLAYYAGLTHSLFEAAKRWIAWVPGGLAVSTIFATAGFAAVSGASVATAAVFARIAIPEMLKIGYRKEFAAGVVAAGGTLASLIPPSAILVIYAIIVEESVGQLLLAGFIPGIISAVIYAVLISGRVMLNPELAPTTERYPWSERFRSLPGTTPIVAVIAIIFTAIYGGWATPTEAGALGAFVVMVIALIRGMKFTTFRSALFETAKLTAMIFSIIWGVLIFVRFLGFAGLPDAFASFVGSLDMPPVLIVIMILLGYMVLGMFMDAIGMLLLTLPVVYPAIVGLGYDPIWFGIIVVKMAEICLVTPPIGLNCFVVNGVRPDIPLNDVFRGIGPFFVADIATVGLFIAFPAIVTFLPDLMLKNL